MPSKVYQLVRVLGGSDGKSQMVVGVMVFEDLRQAREAQEAMDEAMHQSMRLKLVDPAGHDAGRLVEFLNELGVVGFRHFIEVHEVVSQVVQPSSPIIIP